MPECPACKVGQLEPYTPPTAPSVASIVTKLKKTISGEFLVIPLIPKIGNFAQHLRNFTGIGPQSVKTQYRCK